MSNNINTIKEDNGSLSYADDVVATIAGKAAVEIEGVNKMCSNLGTGIAELFGKKVPARGVKVESDKEKATLDIFLIVDYGAQVPSVADRVQDNVKKAVETMTGLDVTAVNVHVQGVHVEEEIESETKSKKATPQKQS
ncbi:MAG: Asp23/Gls24 family envelope stress response protein [Eubacteriales bacterium]